MSAEKRQIGMAIRCRDAVQDLSTRSRAQTCDSVQYHFATRVGKQREVFRPVVRNARSRNRWPINLWEGLLSPPIESRAQGRRVSVVPLFERRNYVDVPIGTLGLP